MNKGNNVKKSKPLQISLCGTEPNRETLHVNPFSLTQLLQSGISYLFYSSILLAKAVIPVFCTVVSTPPFQILCLAPCHNNKENLTFSHILYI